MIRLNLIRCNISEDDYSRMVADLKSRCSKDLEKIQGKRRSEQEIIDLQLNFQLIMLENEEIRRERQVEHEESIRRHQEELERIRRDKEALAAKRKLLEKARKEAARKKREAKERMKRMSEGCDESHLSPPVMACNKPCFYFKYYF